MPTFLVSIQNFFSDIRNNGLQPGQLNELSKHLIKFDESATDENLRIELKNLTLHWDKLKTCGLEDYKIIRTANDIENNNEPYSGDLDDNAWPSSKTCSACKNCAFAVSKF